MALYRRYRPQQFQDVIGQEQVTKPLMAALRADKTAHAYLFSGPRGCGKTTSARILAKCLNCEKAPTDTPCGECESCRELALSGSGSLDVVEMDAASHGGVDDARDLIERASFAPARDRYKIFIIDEAHMVSNQGFNALLKLVEEPPPHIKFIFATTEPEKVIGTIRSRTHHYPFRLVPPDVLESFLGGICTDEGIDVGAGVLPLVVRSGGGSVRDSLSVLDQLMGGSEGGVVNYQDAVGLLGYTDGSLLDDFVEALAVNDGATVFAVVDRVVQSGHDPRRFVEDLLQRLRDLIVIALAGEHATDVLSSVPQDQIERMEVQSGHLGAAKASRSADLVNDALSSMVGATSPRLQLELLCARLLIPEPVGAVSVNVGMGERGPGERPARPASAQRPGGMGRPAATGQPAQAQSVHAQSGSVASGGSAPDDTDHGQGVRDGGAPTQGQQRPMAQASIPMVPGRQINPAWAAAAERPEERAAVQEAPRVPQGSQVPQESRGEMTPSSQQSMPQRPVTQQPQSPVTQQPQSPRPADSASSGPAPATSTGGPQPKDAAPENADASIIRQRWNEVVAAVQSQSRSTAALIQANAQVGSLAGGVLTLAFQTAGLATTFNNRGHAPRVEAALHDVLGIRARVQGSVGSAQQVPAPRGQGGGVPTQQVQAASEPNPPRAQSPMPAVSDAVPHAVPDSAQVPLAATEVPSVPHADSGGNAVSQELEEAPSVPGGTSASAASATQNAEESWPVPVAPPRSSSRSTGASANASPQSSADPAGVLAQLVDNSVDEILARSTVPAGHQASRVPDEDGKSEMPSGLSGEADSPSDNVDASADEIPGATSPVVTDNSASINTSLSEAPANPSPDSRSASKASAPGASSAEVPAASQRSVSAVPAPPFDEHMVPPPLDEEPDDEPFYAQQMPVPPRPQDFGQPTGANIAASERVQPQQQTSPQPASPQQQPASPPQQPAPLPQAIPAAIPPRPQGFGQPGQSPQSPQSAARSNSIASRIRKNHGNGQPQSNGFGNGGFNTGLGNGEFGGYRGNSGYPGNAGNSGYVQAPNGQNDIHDDSEVSADDPTIAQSNLVGIDVVLDTFHGTVIEEIIGKKEV